MRSLILALSLLVVGTTVSAAEVASASEPVTIMSARDDRGDAKLFPRKGLSLRDKRSLDIRRVDVTQVSRNRVQFTIKLARVAPKRVWWDQMVFFTAWTPGAKRQETVDVAFTQRSNDGGYAYDSKSETWCELRQVTRQPKKRQLSVVVPLRCAPWEGMKLEVRTFTGTFRSNAPTFSSDTLKVPGRWHWAY